MLVAWASDRLRHRFLFTLIPIAIGIAGFAILLTGPKTRDLKYAALFLVTSGCYSAMPVIVCWFTMNLGSHHRRSVGSAWQIGFGNIGGIIATFSFLQKDAPGYKPGYSICIAFICLSAASCLVYFVAVWSQNKHRAKTLDVGITEYEQTELGDRATTYRYQL
jgi:MFS family permease